MNQMQEAGQRQQTSQPPTQAQAQGGQGMAQFQQQQVQQASTGQLFPTQNTLPQDVRVSSIRTLNQCLADTMVLQTQLKAAHWNVKGQNFFQLHELFDEIAEVLQSHADDLAERATALGGQALGTVHIAARQSSIPELPPEVVNGQDLLQRIASHLATHDSNLYQQLEAVSQQDDLDTADLLNEISREVTKYLWFVEAHLQGQHVTSTQMQNSQGP